MRISERLYKGRAGALSCGTGRVTNGIKSRVAAEGSSGTSMLSLVAPPGMEYVPHRDEDAVILSEDNRRLFMGIRMNRTENDLKAGELLLYSKGGASIYLTNDGEIMITGTVIINGVPLEVE